MGKKVELKERSTNETLYPITLSEHVLISDSSTLTNKLTQIDEKLNQPVNWNNVVGGNEAIQDALEWYEG